MEYTGLKEHTLYEHILLNLLLAFLGILFAGGGTVILWIGVAIAIGAARISGRLIVRVVNTLIDARTAGMKEQGIGIRGLVRSAAFKGAIISSLILITTSFLINRIFLYLSCCALLLIIAYPLVRRFTSTGNFYRSFLMGLIPAGGYLAVKDELNSVPLILGLATIMWFAGIDIIHTSKNSNAIGQEDDSSLATRLGEEKALIISLITYLFSLSAFIAAGIFVRMNIAYWVSLACVALIFVRQQLLSRAEDYQTVSKEIMQINTYVVPVLFMGTVIDVFMR
jgi:4-hydroxybenzoate polyprenyltransferase